VNKSTRAVGVAIGGGLTLASLTACSHASPSIGQCGIVTGRGAFNNQTVKKVVHPGAKVTKGSKEIAWYVPCDVRNYVTGHDGDRERSAVLKLQNGRGAQPGTPVYVYSRAPFQLRQDDTSLKAWFRALCLKYGCASQKAQQNSDNANKTRSSDPGWRNLLAEQFGPALDRAFQNVMEDPQYANKFGPTTWTAQGWPELDKALTAALPNAMRQTSGFNLQWVCAPTADDKVCNPPQVHVTAIQPTSKQIEDQYDQQVAAENAQAVNKARLDAATKIYGAQASYWLGLQDTMRLCQSLGKQCTFYVGNPPTTAR
jgi:cell wall assembly regulator SMI1